MGYRHRAAKYCIVASALMIPLQYQCQHYPKADFSVSHSSQQCLPSTRASPRKTLLRVTPLSSVVPILTLSQASDIARHLLSKALAMRLRSIAVEDVTVMFDQANEVADVNVNIPLGSATAMDVGGALLAVGRIFRAILNQMTSLDSKAKQYALRVAAAMRNEKLTPVQSARACALLGEIMANPSACQELHALLTTHPQEWMKLPESLPSGGEDETFTVVAERGASPESFPLVVSRTQIDESFEDLEEIMQRLSLEQVAEIVKCLLVAINPIGCSHVRIKQIRLQRGSDGKVLRVAVTFPQKEHAPSECTDAIKTVGGVCLELVRGLDALSCQAAQLGFAESMARKMKQRGPTVKECFDMCNVIIGWPK